MVAYHAKSALLALLLVAGLLALHIATRATRRRTTTPQAHGGSTVADAGAVSIDLTGPFTGAEFATLWAAAAQLGISLPTVPIKTGVALACTPPPTAPGRRPMQSCQHDQRGPFCTPIGGPFCVPIDTLPPVPVLAACLPIQGTAPAGPSVRL